VCRKALEMAVWTDPKQIDAVRKAGLAPLFE
jgi:hypothetical protein